MQMVDADEDAEGVARRLRGLKRLRIHIKASEAFEVTTESRGKPEEKTRTRFNWLDYIDNFELVEIERAEE